MDIPVYLIAGFLDSGKTKFIQETLEDPRFNAGERTLVLIFEEGEEEYDLSTYPKKNVYLEVLDQQTVTTEELKALQKKYKAERVVAELNGMQQVGDLYMRFPDSWAIAQEVMFADATTFMTYNANMRNLVMDKLVGAQMVVFNRLEKGADVMPLHKLVNFKYSATIKGCTHIAFNKDSLIHNASSNACKRSFSCFLNSLLSRGILVFANKTRIGSSSL